MLVMWICSASRTWEARMVACTGTCNVSVVRSYSVSTCTELVYV